MGDSRDFTEKISGAKKNNERKELASLLSYARVHYINRVLVTELSRLGRDTLQVLAAIDMLNKAKVSLYIMNYNIETLTPDGKVNPICLLKSENCHEKVYQRRCYASHKNELQRKSREYHR